MKNIATITLTSLIFACTASIPLRAVQASNVDPLTGHWQGKYYYKSAKASANGTDTENPFDADIQQAGVHFTGDVSESVKFKSGAHALALHAQIINGTVSENGEVSFTKKYDGKDGWSHSVKYQGKLVEDSKSIDLRGTWTIDDNSSGKFEMHRLIQTR